MTDFKIPSTTDLSKYYSITVECDPPRVSCTCTGCAVHGYCKHIRFYKKAIGKLLGNKEGNEIGK